MAYPSKQKQIYSILDNEFREKFYPGARLPSERDYAERLGIARRTLRFVFDRLEEENRIVRNSRGTFLRDERNDAYGRQDVKNPLTILLPCPDYLDASEHSSAYTHSQMILGAMRAAVEAGTHVVTLPVSETNNPEDINWLQLRHLHANSMVMFSGSWFRNVYPLLAERKCRIGCIYGGDNPLFTEKTALTSINCRTSGTRSFLYHAVNHLHAEGAENILYFGSSAADISRTGKSDFLKALREKRLKCEESNFHVYNAQMPLIERMKLLAACYRKQHFDALILELNPYREHDREFDPYELCGIPLSTKLMITVSDLLHQEKIAEHALVCHLPVMRISYEIGKFLLSGNTGHVNREVQYIFQNAKNFIEETNYK